MASVYNNYSYFVNNETNKPLYNGFIYFGNPDTDARIPANQVAVRVLQEDGSLVKIPQPIRTNDSGIAVFLGTPIIINLEDSLFSTYVEDSNNTLLYTRPRSIFTLPDISGNAGNYLGNDGSTISWSDPLPSQTGEATKTLSTNGTIDSWEELLPPQATNEGKTLSTDGTNPLWASNLPDQTPALSGNFLFTNGNDSSWNNPIFQSQIINNTDTVHNFDVTIPESGKLLVISSAQLFITPASGISSGTYNLTLDLNGNSSNWQTIGTVNLLNSMYCSSYVLIEGTAGSVENINSTTTAFPLESNNFTYSLYNHLTVVVGGF